MLMMDVLIQYMQYIYDYFKYFASSAISVFADVLASLNRSLISSISSLLTPSRPVKIIINNDNYMNGFNGVAINA